MQPMMTESYQSKSIDQSFNQAINVVSC